jgi:hypothetical protein
VGLTTPVYRKTSCYEILHRISYLDPLERPTCPNKLSAFYGTRSCIIVFTRTGQWTLLISHMNLLYTFPYPVFLRHILISSHRHQFYNNSLPFRPSDNFRFLNCRLSYMCCVSRPFHLIGPITIIVTS